MNTTNKIVLIILIVLAILVQCVGKHANAESTTCFQNKNNTICHEFNGPTTSCFTHGKVTTCNTSDN